MKPGDKTKEDDAIAAMMYEMLATGREHVGGFNRRGLQEAFRERFPQACDRPLKRKGGK